MTISAIAPKLRVHRARPEIVHHFKIVVRDRRGIVRKAIALLIKIVALVRKVIVRRVIVLRIRTADLARPVHRMPTRPNSVVGMSPMVSILAHA